MSFANKNYAMETTLSSEFANKEVRKSPFVEGAAFKIVKIEEGSFNGNSFLKIVTNLDERGLSVRSFTRPTFGRFVKQDGTLEAQPRVSVPAGTANKAVAEVLAKDTVKTNGDLAKALIKVFDKKTLICHVTPFQTLDGRLSSQLSFDFK